MIIEPITTRRSPAIRVERSALFSNGAKDRARFFTLDICQLVPAVDIFTVISATDFADKMRTSDNQINAEQR